MTRSPGAASDARGATGGPATIRPVEPQGTDDLERGAMEAEKALVADVAAGAAARAATLAEAEQTRVRDARENEVRHKETLEALERDWRAATEAATTARDAAVGEAEATFASEMMRLARKRELAVEEARAKAEAARTSAQRVHDEAVWLAESVYEGSEGKPRADYEKLREEITTNRKELEELIAQGRTLVRRYRQVVPALPAEDPGAAAAATGNPSMAMTAALGVARHQLTALRGLRIPGLFKGPILLVPWMLAAGGAVTAAGALRAWDDVPVLVGAGVGMTAVVVVAAAALWMVARRQVRAAWMPLAEAQRSFATAADAALERAATERADRERALLTTRDMELEKARSAVAPKLAEIAALEAETLRRIEEKLPGLRRRLTETRDAALAEAAETFARTTRQADEDRQARRTAEMARVEARRTEVAAVAAATRAAAIASWHALQRRTMDTVEALARADAERSPGWEAPSWAGWTPPRTFAPVVRVGRVDLDLTAVPEAMPADPQLAWDLRGRPPQLPLPVGLVLPERASLLLETGAEGRAQAIATLQATMLRLLAGMPPGKVHLVVLDPVGLGQSFAGFMHLADANPRLVGDRIWTEQRHIEQKLVDLTEHMETVIQKYLRDEFPTIRDYNEQAGELAEPYRFLVVADYPANFSEQAAARLNSIVNSGARCGVFTLIARDVRRELPPTADLAALHRNALRVEQRAERLVLATPGLDHLALHLDPAPPADLVIPAMRKVGEAAVDAGRVEVPFSVIAPAPEKLWCESSASILKVALGRTGATKLQSLVLGEGTKQHVLIAGKTGSGKSTLLHALITNTALWYGPDEVEMYLIDFKKGVEFKTYANHRLPHARAVAIESDREFGLSVLQGLDGELKRRGDLYRDLGVQDLKGFRALKRPDAMPRVLLVVDEFQELFIEDDKVAQEAALLLDRLVRQGRAFGMHVILGSQTLGGAYSLPRTTMGQMAVRIALQCNEADAQLILSDDNTAARLLGRPGEAIYNDAGGLVQGNSPFQIVWLSDEIRDQWLERAGRKSAGSKRPAPIVFEGNIPADIAQNHLLAQRVAAPAWAPMPAAVSAWLGDAISIKDPTAAVFRRQNGANVVVVGQRDDAALAVSTSMLLSLASQLSPEQVRFVLLDGTPADDPLAGSLERVARTLPHGVEVVPYREAGEAVIRVAEMAAARQHESGADAPWVFLMIHGLHRFRALRRNEDDYSFSSEEKPASPDKAMAAILRDGPAVGVHAIAWVDTLASLNRAVDRAAMREFDQRVLFQLSGTDSSTLIDSPAATRLGMNRALLYSEEAGTLEKFRPYSPPDPAWLERTAAAMAKRSRG